MSKINKLMIVLLLVIFCISSFSISTFAVGENEGEGGYSDVITDDSQGGESSGGDYVEVPPEDIGGDSDSSGITDDSSGVADDSSGVADDSNSSADGSYADSDSSNSDYNNNIDYSDSDSSDYNYDYDYSDSNNYSDNSAYSDNNYYDEPSYLGGGQTYVEPENIAPSASLYDANGTISDKTLNSGDWNDISERLKNASVSADDGDDFAYIQNNNSTDDNGSWMLIVSILCFVLSAAGILYFIVLTVQSRSAGKYTVAASSAKRSNKSSKFDTAEVTLPKSSGNKRYKNSGKRYK